MFYTYTFFAENDAKSTRGYTCMQIFVSDKGYVAVYPMKSKSEFKDCLHMFCKEIGVPETLFLDKSGEQTSNAVKHFSNQIGLKLRILEESTQWVIEMSFTLKYSKKQSERTYVPQTAH